MAINNEYSNILDKYRDMVATRKEYGDININDYLPSIYDMLKEDCVWDALKAMQNSLNGGKDHVEDMAYYVENPPTTTPGYYEKENCFVLRCSKFNAYANDWSLGEITGDTWYFNLDNVTAGENFTVAGKDYKDYKEYAAAHGLDCSSLTIKSAGINASNVCHYGVTASYDEKNVITMKYGDAIKKGYTINPYKIDRKGSKDPEKWSITKYDYEEKIKLLKSGDSYSQIMEDMNGTDFIPKKNFDEKATYYVIVGYGENWGSETVRDGYKAQYRLRELIEHSNVKDIITVIDRNILLGKRTKSGKIYYSSLLFMENNIENFLDDFHKSIFEYDLSRLSFSPFGCNKYGYSFGNTWVKIGTADGDMWINASKYVQSGTDFTENNPKLSDINMQEAYSGLSEAFKSWNNTTNEFRYVDSLDSSGQASYTDRINLHKELTGLDFSGDARNCTILLGDTLFMLPPQAIRTSSSLEYEKIPILRGKGTMAKNKTNIEELIELELYFNSDAGINGVPYETTTPNGTKVTYYMNGLRSLLSQFKVAPFLPIENHYINDVLSIEVVSLVNINASTVEGFPGLLRVVLTLRDFNYRVFMPDLPLPNYTADEDSTGSVSEMQHVFAKCFDWELFRYYYQRALIHGTDFKKLKYNSKDWCEYLYSYKNLLCAANLSSSEFEMYVPDIEWLKSALQVKKTRDYSGYLASDGSASDENLYVTSTDEDELIIKNSTKPLFSSSDKTSVTFSTFSELDKLGRCGVAYANIGRDSMPTDHREDISSVTPSAWENNNNSYPSIEGGYIYNRCHLIGYQLTGENANEKNLITGTRYLNVDGMLIYENKVADYLKANPNNHVLYRVTPVFEGDNLLASGVTMEAQSVEDDNLVFNVYIKNIQPGVKIKYSTGQNKADETQLDENSEYIYDHYNYKEPKNMKFVPYLQNEDGESVKIELDSMSFSMSNTFTETHLKAVDGYAPQFMGGSDISIELMMTLTSEYFVAALTTLPHVANDMIRNYRKVMPCYPIRIKNDYLQMIGVNEVLIDNIEINTKEGMPGTYEVRMQLTSVDRTMRQREALVKASVDDAQTSSLAATSIGDYFELQKSLAQAELYPDLDLPTLKELGNLGWKFAKWANEERLYVDPDFYVCYSFQYAAKLAKEVINNVLYKVSYNAGIKETDSKTKDTKLSDEDQKAIKDAGLLNQLRLIDQEGIGMDVHAGVDYDGLNIDEQLGYADIYDTITKQIQDNSENDTTKKKTLKQQNKKENLVVLGSAVQYLTASGIEDGWQVAPGWYAPICSTYLNDEMEKFSYAGIKQEAEASNDDNKFIEEVYDLRHRAIMLIDKVLDKPLIAAKNTSWSRDPGMQIQIAVDVAVDSLFGTDEGKNLLNLLCPMVDPQKKAASSGSTLDLRSTYFEYAVPLRWIKGLLFSLACVRSGHTEYSDSKTNWKPVQWQDVKYSDDDEEARKAGYAGKKIPYNKIEGVKSAGDSPFAQTYNSWHEDGISFGCGQITRHTASTIKNMMQPKSKITYFNKGYKTGAAEYYNNMYYKTKKAGRDRFCETGFIDPYYNYAGYNSAEGKKYIELISNSQSANLEALMREVLVHLKRMIMDGYYFGEIDVIAQDWESCLEDLLDVDDVVDGGLSEENDGESLLEKMWRAVTGDMSEQEQAALDFGNSSMFNFGDAYKEYRSTLSNIVLGDTGLNADFVKQLREEIPKTYAKIFCARLIYPFVSAATGSATEIYKIFEKRDYATLNTYTLASTVGCNTNTDFNKFLNAMYGIGMIGSSDVMDSGEITSNTQKAFNLLMSEAFTALANDPRCYTLHSMYDMCVTDKRGRLLRAFPCYYVMFVDEGRTIGTWKLFDNFYNMSSISNIQVVKSRKMPADTCSFTMSNMFMSYSDTYDNSIYQQYVEMYSFKDVFSSVFSPRSYIQKEDMLRQRKQLMDTTPIAPGVRLHVRMGYGSDGSQLPIVFNGKIAEVDCGDIVEIVAQGDGHELNNPLNTLGELTARNFEESQGWCTLFKDIRGSVARGGETPRNLLTKLATAQYGGAFKTVVREYSKGRFFYDNPFGVYHFGDKRFKDVFSDSEIVQNLYEVSDKTILNGINDLIGDISTVKAAPIINCTIQDKTLWEIGHLCANAGDDYYFAVRDFGLRSTMCLCKSNHYYAYEYQKVSKVDEDGIIAATDVIAEKRKPFQQWHYFDSYNDIIYNSIKASETNMKTNAVGTWEGSDWLWGTGQQSVGPIYLDMNIFPEYQKSMTVETGLVAGGDGGINIPVINALSEKFNYNEYDGFVNKSLAEKVTTNVLRQSVKDMYEGEMCIIGDTSLKPYDRVTIVDLYEDMSGDMEVETVIHSMNMETGFTTTFIPDLIVRSENSAQECGTQGVLGPVITSLVGTITAKSAIYAAAGKSSGAILKLGTAELAAGEGLVKTFMTNAAKKAMSSMVPAEMLEKGATEAILLAMKNPIALAGTAIAAGSIFMIAANAKEMFTRWCRNIQALTVFPIQKNNRCLVAGMSGHKGSVYGFSYSENGSNPRDSIQNMVMTFLDGDTDHSAVNAVGWVFKLFLNDENYKITQKKWINNLGLETSNDIINNDAAYTRNLEAFRQSILSSISSEYTSRNVTLAAIKSKPRLTSFNTEDRTSPIYLKYQIGGIGDRFVSNAKNDETERYIGANELSDNDRIKGLLAVEDEADVKMAVIENCHPVLKSFKFAHSSSSTTFFLKMEHENTEIRYITDKANDKEKTPIFDLPMLQEEAIIVLKLIMNEDSLKKKTLTFLSGTRVNSTNSWKSTGFAFSLWCDDMTALETAVKNVKKDSCWVYTNNGDKLNAFAYKNNGKSIEITVYPPIVQDSKIVFKDEEEDDSNE